MQAEQLVENMNEGLYLRLKSAVETGRWPDGQPLTAQQKEDSLALVVMYQARHLDQNEPFSVGKDGQMVVKSKAELRQQRDEQEITRFNLSSDETRSSVQRDSAIGSRDE